MTHRASIHCDPRRHGYAWHVDVDGEQIVTSSGDPEYDACRVLADRGHTGPIEFVDGITGQPRMRIARIEVAARYRMADERRDGLRLRLRREGPFATRRGLPRTALNEPDGTKCPPPENGPPEPTDAGGPAL